MSGDVCFPGFYQMTAAEPVAADERDLESLLLVYQLQAEQCQEDFEQERQDHQRTKAQVQSLTTQWNNLHDELRRCQSKVRCRQWRFYGGGAEGPCPQNFVLSPGWSHFSYTKMLGHM